MSAGCDRLLALARDACGDTFRDGAPLGVAVSGGSDSMALLHLFHAAGHTVRAVTLDHGLRPEAADEARFVAAACARLGVPHQTLRWDGPAPRGNLADQARQARYGLIAGWAAACGLTDVLIGHTADDQAETFLMRLSRGAGLDGLSGMRRDWRQGGVRFHRPLLTVARADLRDWLRRRGIGWIEDPSNADPRSQRVRARRALAALAPLGIDAGGLGRVTALLDGANRALMQTLAERWPGLGRTEAGDVVLNRDAVAALPDELLHRLLARALMWVSANPYPPRGGPMLALRRDLARGRARTLHGCRILTGADLRITREWQAVRDMVARPGEVWDRRWVLAGPDPAAETGAEIRALGPVGLRHCPGWRDTGLPRASLIATPAVWRQGRPIAAPLAGRPGGWSIRPAEHRVGLVESLLSH